MHMKDFYKVLANSLIAGVTTSFLWFALTFWAYLGTRSVLATSIIGGAYMLLASLAGLYFGTYVDHHKKKVAMLHSSLVTGIAFALAAMLYVLVPERQLLDLSGWAFWALVGFTTLGAIAGNLRMIALSTTVSLMVPEDQRDKANGWVGTSNGVAFAITSVFSGLVVGRFGFDWALWLSLMLTLAVTLHVWFFVRIPEKHIAPNAEDASKVDVRGALAAIRSVDGLMGLIMFTTFNNFLGGVYMSLMDAYGLSLVSVETWGLLWGLISIGFIVGGLVIAKKGLGKSPLRTLFKVNIILWIISIVFTLRTSIVLTTVGLFLYMCLMPVVEAAEQTIIQKVVPHAKQGRVFGFAQSIESAAMPITAFLIGPIAEWFFIPTMVDGRGAELIGDWFGRGYARGLALVFVLAGIIGLVVTLLARRSRAYQTLSKRYIKGGAPANVAPVLPEGIA